MRHNGDFSGNGNRMEWTQAIAGALGMAVPIITGVASGHSAAGFAACAGSLMLGGTASARSTRDDAREIAEVLVPAIAGTVIAAFVAGRGLLEHLAVVVLAACISLVGGMSRFGAIAAVRFVLFLLVAIGVAENMPERVAAVALIVAGACWAATVSFVVALIARAMRRSPEVPRDDEHPPPTARARFARWQRSLRHLEGWQYAMRLTFCLAAAALFDSTWPDHHLRWTAITVVLLTERRAQPWPRKTFERAAGTLAGVFIAAVAFGTPPSSWVLPIAMGFLAGMRPLLRNRSYAAYTAITTPLILAILDGGEAPDIALLLDRLAATLIAAALVLAANAVFGRAATSVS